MFQFDLSEKFPSFRLVLEFVQDQAWNTEKYVVIKMEFLLPSIYVETLLHKCTSVFIDNMSVNVHFMWLYNVKKFAFF